MPLIACSTCKDLERPFPTNIISIAILDSSVVAGCPYCNLLQQCISGFFRLVDVQHFTICISSGAEGLMLWVKLHKGYQGPAIARRLGDQDLALFIPPGQKSPGPWVQTQLSIPDHPDSEESFKFIESSLQQCVSKHEICARSPASRIFPARIVDINPAVKQSVQIIKYTESLGPYIALSHCWGGSLPINLNFSTFTNLCRGVNLDVLPNTFRDAIEIARRLGIRYIFIDALCIIQDSNRDWEKESSKMGSIYSNAFVTICASSSNSCDVSFLARSSRLICPTLDVVFKDRNNTQHNLKVMRRLDDHGGDDPESGPLHQRAWGYQEYHLSKRLISYNNTEIVFKCRTETRCQCQQRSYSVSSRSQLLFDSSTFSKAQILNDWRSIVGGYTDRELSRCTDRLAALSGIASSIQKATGWTYVAGIWKDVALHCLSWFKLENPNSKNYDDLCNLAPSFSWASVDGPIVYNGVLAGGYSSQYEIHTSVIQLQYCIAGRNPFNLISPHAFIELNGPLLRVHMFYDGTCTFTCYAEYSGSLWRFHADAPLGVLASGAKSVIERRKEMGTEKELNGLPIYVLFLATKLQQKYPTINDAIVLTKLEAGVDIYKRIGMLLPGSHHIVCPNDESVAVEICSIWLRDAKRTRLRLY